MAATVMSAPATVASSSRALSTVKRNRDGTRSKSTCRSTSSIAAARPTAKTT
jgi:hypothetical protein